MWRRLFRKHATDAELEEELQAHLAIEARQLMDRGHSRDQAEAHARSQLGSQALIMELTREAWGWASMARFWQDTHYAARVLRRQPAFTVAAVVSLALGIGATTAVFSIADTIFLRPLPYLDAGQLVWVGIHLPGLGSEFLLSPDYVTWRRDNHVFRELAATQGSFSSTMVLGGADPAEVQVGRVSANFFETFAALPALGRTFKAAEELPNGPRAVVLTNQFWRERFHGSPEAIGSILTLDSQPYKVVGVLPQTFVNPVDVKVALFTTLPVSPSASHNDRSMSLWAVYGRLKPGVTLAQARTEVAALFAASKADAPQIFRRDNWPLVEPLRERRAGDAHTLLFVLMGAAACLLAIACANVANLLLARWSAGAHELAVRAAIGAGRARLSRQLFTEIALVVAAGTAVATVFVAAALHAFVHFAAGELPRLSQVTVDFRVFGIALAASVTTALLFGVLPAVWAGRIHLQSALQGAGRSSASAGHRPVRRVLVSVEVALSVILLSGAALLLETLWHMQHDHLGFIPEHLLTVSIPLRGKSIDDSMREALTSDVWTYVRRIPGTEAAALTQCTPLVTSGGMRTFSRSDRPLPEAFHRGDNISVCGTGPGYLKAAGTRLLEGRFFSDDDFQHPGTLAVINQTAARAYFPDEDAIGRQILGGRVGPWKTVVGIAADTKNQGLDRPATPEAFVNDTSPAGTRDLLLLVRTVADEDFVARALHDDLRIHYPGLLSKTETLDQAIDQLSAGPRFNTILLSTFAAVAFLMAIVGVYGVLTFSVAQRRQEIGIRMALGATPIALIGLIMKEAARLVAAGAFVGMAVALILTRFLATLLYDVAPNDPATYAAVIVGLALTAAVASYFPAHGAATLDPIITLRHE